jgi:fructose-1,6-bisphosphatase/inositol monophosphatase family enzyme
MPARSRTRPETSLDVDAVTAAIDRATQELILPRFQKLSSSQIELKWTPENPADVVTVVDRTVERYLTDVLRSLAPGHVVIGEEAAHDDPELLRLLHADDPVWLIDPIDGTRNFAAGDDRFGLMVALVLSGQTRAAWIVLPVRGDSYVAQYGSGVYRNGERLKVAPSPRAQEPRGSVMSRYMPADTAAALTRSLRGRFASVPPSGCAAVEYTDLLEGRRDFVVYYRLHPWDHGGAALMLHEAGGALVHLDGKAYTVRSGNQVTIAAAHPRIAADLIGWLARERHMPAQGSGG